MTKRREPTAGGVGAARARCPAADKYVYTSLTAALGARRKVALEYLAEGRASCAPGVYRCRDCGGYHLSDDGGAAYRPRTRTPTGGAATVCGGCGLPRRVKNRGLCAGCLGKPEVRARHPDRRTLPRTAAALPPAAAGDLLACPVLRRTVAKHATRIARAFGPRVRVEDVVQAGWVVLVRSARTFRPARGPSLWKYCARGALGQMRAEAGKCLRDGLYADRAVAGESEAETVARLSAEWLDRLKGWRWVGRPGATGRYAR